MRDDAKGQKNKQKKSSKSAGTLGAVLVLFSFSLLGCQGKPGIEGFCGEIPGAQTELRSFRTALSPYVVSGRKPASVASPTPALRADWLAWTEKALKRMQWARDGLEDERKARPALSHLNEVSFSLVTVHGFVEQGKWKKASAELEKIEQTLEEAAVQACPRSTQRAPAAAKAAALKRK